VGAGEESIDCIIDGEAVQAAFNGKYLLDVLRVMQQPSLQMEFCGSLKPAIMRPHAEEKVFDYLCVVMPMQMV
jgi:DNA polymerase-3 subunit beta